jgi:hypothetical protein
MCDKMAALDPAKNHVYFDIEEGTNTPHPSGINPKDSPCFELVEQAAAKVAMQGVWQYFEDHVEYYPPQAILRVAVFCSEEGYEKWLKTALPSEVLVTQ